MGGLQYRPCARFWKRKKQEAPSPPQGSLGHAKPVLLGRRNSKRRLD